jgi:hypothetical protein
MSGFFTFTTRTCGRCGADWEALDFWADDMLCHDCNRKDFDAWLAEINATKHYTLKSIGGAWPTQATGMTADNRPFYFRARHGTWKLEVGGHGWPVDYGAWPEHRGDLLVAMGDDSTHGDMASESVLAILDAHLGDER